MASTTLAPRNPEAMRAAMYAAGYDIVRIAQVSGVSKQFISLLVRGRRRCSPAIAAAISQALGHPVDELFGDSLCEESNNKETCMTVQTDDPLLTFEEVAELARMEPKSLRHLRHAGQGPDFFKIGRRLKIRRSAAEAWISQYEHGSSDSTH